MSDSQAYDTVRVRSHGVTVTKRFEEDEFPVPAIAFEFESERDEQVVVTLSDTVPEGVEVEDLGFHPEYGSEFWTIEDEVITFEKDLEANSSYTTVYGIRATDTEDVEQFLTEPMIESVDPPLPDEENAGDEDIVPESGDDVIKNAITGDGEIPGLEDDETEPEEAEGDEDVDTLDLKDPNAKNQASSASQTTSDTTEQAGAEDEQQSSSPEEVSVDGSVVSTLAEEIRQGTVSADDVKLLRRAFEVAGQEGGTVNAKIRQIQTDISDLRAYTSSLEDFLEENGGGKELIEDFGDRLDEFDEQLDGIQAELDSVGEELSGVSSEMDGVTTEVDELGEEVASVSDEMGAFSGDIEDVHETVEQLEDAIGDLESEMERIEEEMTGGEVDERLASIEEDIQDLKDWQEQIKKTFGG